MPFYKLNARAAVSTSTNPDFKYTNVFPGVSVNDSDLILEKAGVRVLQFAENSGAMLFPSMSEVIGNGQATESTAIGDVSVTSTSRTLAPRYVTASADFTKVFLASAKPETIQAIADELVLGVYKKRERMTIDSMTGLTAIASGSTAITTTVYNAAVQLEAAINGTPNFYVFPRAAYAKGKNSRKDSGSGLMAIENGELNGYPVYRSTLQSSASQAYLVTASAMAMAQWGDISIRYIEDTTSVKAGTITLIASGLVSGSYLDANKVAIIKNADKLT
jgi:hypothetical protein